MTGKVTIGTGSGLRILTTDDKLRKNGLKTQFGAHVTNLCHGFRWVCCLRSPTLVLGAGLKNGLRPITYEIYLYFIW